MSPGNYGITNFQLCYQQSATLLFNRQIIFNLLYLLTTIVIQGNFIYKNLYIGID